MWKHWWGDHWLFLREWDAHVRDIWPIVLRVFGPSSQGFKDLDMDQEAVFVVQRERCFCCCCWVASVMSDSVQPQRRQPTRLPRPWDSPGKNTGVGCHFLLLCMKVKSQSEVAQSCPTLSDPMDCSLPGSSVHGIFQARVLEWGAIAFSGEKDDWNQKLGTGNEERQRWGHFRGGVRKGLKWLKLHVCMKQVGRGWI